MNISYNKIVFIELVAKSEKLFTLLKNQQIDSILISYFANIESASDPNKFINSYKNPEITKRLLFVKSHKRLPKVESALLKDLLYTDTDNHSLDKTDNLNDKKFIRYPLKRCSLNF